MITASVAVSVWVAGSIFLVVGILVGAVGAAHWIAIRTRPPAPAEPLIDLGVQPVDPDATTAATKVAVSHATRSRGER